MESRILDFPDPFSPVMALNDGSKPDTTVRDAYDLNPSTMTSSIYISSQEKFYSARIFVHRAKNRRQGVLFQSRSYPQSYTPSLAIEQQLSRPMRDESPT
mmetsp:Transcript_4456/g.19104  ORF Transcript_4456/g.19104 Transcript_4456/m.19104 type:complete len:100 (+) Transcript_4456:3906-4205(+)